jgi:hypothetical protein
LLPPDGQRLLADGLLLPPDDLPVVRFHGRARKRSCESLSYYLSDRWQAQMQFGLFLVLHFAGGGVYSTGYQAHREPERP